MTPRQAPSYRPGDVVNGHVLTPQMQWVPVWPPPEPGRRLGSQHHSPVSGPRPVRQRQASGRLGSWLRGRMAGPVAATTVGVVAMSIAFGGAEPQPVRVAQPAVTETPEPNAPDPVVAATPEKHLETTKAETFDGDGTFEVGVEIHPGTYRSSGSGYWQRLSGTSGEYEDTIASHFAEGGPAYVTIDAGDKYFSTQDFDPWVPVADIDYGTPHTAFDGDGMYRVGKDIRPGTYRSSGENGSWELASDASGEYESVIAREGADAPGGQTLIVRITGADKYFSTIGLGDWERVHISSPAD